jgi:hypothetical protein
LGFDNTSLKDINMTTITNTWGVVQMDCYPQYEGQPDIVFNVHWNLQATDGTYGGYTYGSTNIPLTEGATFTPYEDLTKEQVLGWVHEALGEEQVEAYEANVEQQIEKQRNPTVVNPPLPWAQLSIPEEQN